MTDKQRIAALREALIKAGTPDSPLVFYDYWRNRAVERLHAINSIVLEALKADDRAEIAGGEQ
jgi:hypothetical protein